MRDILIWGASGHARVVAEIVRLEGQYRALAFVDDHTRGDVDDPGTIPLLRSRDAVLDFQRSNGKAAVIVAVGDNAARLLIYEWCLAHSFEIATAIHPAAVVSSESSIGRGTVVMGGAVINTGATVAEFAIINSNSTVEHDCTLGPGVHISPGAHLGGNVIIGRGTWIGLGAVVRNRTSVGAGSIIGAGAVVTRDVPDNVIVVGNPAKVVRSNDAK